MKPLDTTTATPTPPTTQREIQQRLKGHTLTVELSAEEAWVILALCCRISGNMINTPREHASNIYDTLAPALRRITGVKDDYSLTSTSISCLHGDIKALTYENP